MWYHAVISAKIVRLLQRVVGVRTNLTTESRFLFVKSVVGVRRTDDRDPISPTNPSGAPARTPQDPGPVPCNMHDTPDRGGRRRRRSKGGTASPGAVSGKTARGTP